MIEFARDDAMKLAGSAPGISCSVRRIDASDQRLWLQTLPMGKTLALLGIPAAVLAVGLLIWYWSVPVVLAVLCVLLAVLALTVVVVRAPGTLFDRDRRFIASGVRVGPRFFLLFPRPTTGTCKLIIDRYQRESRMQPVYQLKLAHPDGRTRFIASCGDRRDARALAERIAGFVEDARIHEPAEIEAGPRNNHS